MELTDNYNWTNCIYCGKRIADCPEYDDTDYEACYTDSGSGPFCNSCYDIIKK